MTQSSGLKTAAYMLRFTPAEKEALETKAAAYTARTGVPLTLATALRQGAARYLDELLSEVEEEAQERVVAT